ncbi:hypothetical protein [Streptomyces sp. NPDC050988]|uniref:hypothetical protein n=1 Tax=Streptomyces sp. NPDC050988 TaxID=3365637 RepID=UPI0037B79DA0
MPVADGRPFRASCPFRHVSKSRENTGFDRAGSLLPQDSDSFSERVNSLGALTEMFEGYAGGFEHAGGQPLCAQSRRLASVIAWWRGFRACRWSPRAS